MRHASLPRFFGAFLATIILASVMPACTQEERVREQASAPAQELLIGLIPEQNVFKQMERYEPLTRYIGERAGVTIRLSVLPRYGNIIENFTTGKMDGAFFGSFTYALAHEKIGVDVLARPERFDGTSTYSGLIFVRKENNIQSVKDMKNKRFAFVDKATTAGYLFPLVLFKQQGVDPRSYLKEYYFAGTHEDVINDVLNGKADIGAVKNTVFDRLADTDSRISRELRVLVRSREVPENAFAVRKDFDPALKAKIAEILLHMHENPDGKAVLRAFGAKRFIETTNRDYHAVYDYAKRGGLNLATYDYVND